MEQCQIYKQHFRQQICCLDFSSFKHCEQLNLISQCHCLPGVIDAGVPPHKPGHRYCTQQPDCWHRQEAARAQINRHVNSKLLNLMQPVSSRAHSLQFCCCVPLAGNSLGSLTLRSLSGMLILQAFECLFSRRAV